MQYLYDENGKFAQVIEGTAEEIVAQIPEGYGVTILPPPRNTDYFNGTNWVAIGAPPEYYLTFDYAQRKWIDNRDLVACQNTRWEQIKLQRNQLEFGGFTYKGKKYDSDSTSQGRMLAAFVFAQPVTWTTSDDEVVELSAAEINELGQALAAHVQKVHARGRLARAAILSSASPQEVDAVIF